MRRRFAPRVDRRRALATLILASSAAACSLLADLEGLSGPPRDAEGGSDAPEGEDASAKAEAATDARAPDADAAVVDPRGCDAPGLVAYFKLDEGAGSTTRDCSSNQIGGVLNPDGGGWQAQGIRGAALELEASYVSIPDASAIHLEGAITLAAWVKIEALPNNERPAIVSKMGGMGSRGWELAISTVDAGARVGLFRISPIDVEVTVPSAPLPSTGWIHLAGTFTPGDALRIYVDGEVSGALPIGAMTMKDPPVATRIGGRSYAYYWRGSIDEVRIFSAALSADQIRLLHER
jgi:hypothetical protein